MRVLIEGTNTPTIYQFTGLTAVLRIEAIKGFTTFNGQLVPPGNGSEQDFYMEVPLDITGDQLLIPTIEIDSTEDAYPWDSATTGDVPGYRAYFKLSNGRRIPYFNKFKVPTLAEGDPSMQWDEIRVFNRTFVQRFTGLDRYINVNEVQEWIQNAVGDLNKASENNFGVTMLDVDPAIPGVPVGVGVNSPLLRAGSARVVYASVEGAALDSNLLTGGGTDDTAVIQGMLDLAAGGTPIHVVIDGPALVGALDIYSNTILECVNGGGLYLATGTNRALLRNANPIGTGAVTDKHITLLNCTFNGNYAGQTGIGSQLTREANGTLIGLVQFYGVDDVRVHHCTFRDSKSLALHFSNWTNVDLQDLYFDNNVPGQHQQGGVEFEGPGSKLTVRGIRGTTQDDLFTLASDGGSYSDPPFTGLGPYVGVGSITDVHVVGIVGFGNTLGAVRFFNGASRMDRIVIEGITGTFTTALFWNESGLAPGNIGTVTISHVNVHLINFTGVWPLQYAIGLWGVIDHFILNDITFNDPEDNRGHIFLASTADIKHLDVNGFRVYDTVDRNSTVLFFMNPSSAMRKGDLRGFAWHRGTAHARAGRMFLINPNCIVEDLLIDGVYANRVDNILERNSVVSTASITLRNIRHLTPTTAANVAFYNAIGTVAVFDMSNWWSDLAGRVFDSGTITAKRGDAFTTYGSAVLVAGTVTVPYTDTTAATKVLVNRLTDGGTVGASYSVSRAPGASFTITAKDGAGATQALDTSTIVFEIRD